MPFPFSFSGFGCCVLTCFRQFALPFWLRDFFADSDFAAVQPASASLGALQFPWSWSWVHGLRLLTVASCLALVAEYYDWPPGGGERRPWSSQRFEVPIPFSHLLPLAAESRVLSISLVSMRVLILAENFWGQRNFHSDKRFASFDYGSDKIEVVPSVPFILGLCYIW